MNLESLLNQRRDVPLVLQAALAQAALVNAGVTRQSIFLVARVAPEDAPNTDEIYNTSGVRLKDAAAMLAEAWTFPDAWFQSGGLAAVMRSTAFPPCRAWWQGGGVGEAGLFLCAAWMWHIPNDHVRVSVAVCGRIEGGPGRAPRPPRPPLYFD